MGIFEKLERYINDVNIEKLTMEELEHYTNIIIALENKKLGDKQKLEFNKNIEN